MMPVRNLLGRDIFNRRTKHALQLEGIDENATTEEILSAVLREFHWFPHLRNPHPNSFFCFLENWFDLDTILDMASFLDIKLEMQQVDNVKGYQDVCRFLAIDTELYIELIAEYNNFIEQTISYLEKNH